MDEFYVESELGDLFCNEVERIIKDADMQTYGEHWNMMGLRIYARDMLIGLLSRPYKSKEWTGAY